MTYKEVLQKRAFTGDDTTNKDVSLWRRLQQSVNDHVRTKYTEPQAAAATDATIDKVINRIGEYASPVLAGAGIAGIATHAISEQLNKKRNNEGVQGEMLPTRLLTTLAAIGGGIGGGYLYDKYVKTAAYGDLPTEVTPDMEVPEQEQEALEDPSNSKKKKKKKEKTPDTIKQMIYAQNAKTRHEHMKSASLTYSKVAELMGSTSEPTPGQEWDLTRMTFANPGVSFMWDDEKRQYMPMQWDDVKKTKVPYTVKINPPVQQKTNFSNQKPVTPVQPPASQYTQPDNQIKDIEGLR